MVWTRNQESDESAPTPPRTQTPTPSGRQSIIGPSLKLRGDLTGSENLRVEGSVEGTIQLDKQEVLISQSGQITADIHSRSISVEGRVRGNLYGEEEVIIRPSGTLEGNITAPSVTLENGAKFRGSIDMEPKSKPISAPKSVSKNRPEAKVDSSSTKSSGLGHSPEAAAAKA